MAASKVNTGWYGYEGFIITVGEGEDSSQFFIHSGYACYNSQYFQDLSTAAATRMIMINWRAESPSAVLHLAHWLYSKWAPVLNTENLTACDMGEVVTLFVLAEKYAIPELASKCYQKIYKQLATFTPTDLPTERVKAALDELRQRPSMLGNLLLRVLVYRYSSQEQPADIPYLEQCLDEDPAFAKDFHAELRTNVKLRRMHPYHDHDLLTYRPAPVILTWGDEIEELEARARREPSPASQPDSDNVRPTSQADGGTAASEEAEPSAAEGPVIDTNTASDAVGPHVVLQVLDCSAEVKAEEATSLTPQEDETLVDPSPEIQTVYEKVPETVNRVEAGVDVDQEAGDPLTEPIEDFIQDKPNDDHLRQTRHDSLESADRVVLFGDTPRRTQDTVQTEIDGAVGLSEMLEDFRDTGRDQSLLDNDEVPSYEGNDVEVFEEEYPRDSEQIEVDSDTSMFTLATTAVRRTSLRQSKEVDYNLRHISRKSRYPHPQSKGKAVEIDLRASTVTTTTSREPNSRGSSVIYEGERRSSRLQKPGSQRYFEAMEGLRPRGRKRRTGREGEAEEEEEENEVEFHAPDSARKRTRHETRRNQAASPPFARTRTYVGARPRYSA